MAVTGAIFKRLYFDGEDSGDFGVYITGEAAYNAPERSVEMISIPGRNGAYALDNGRFENMSVSYPAGIYADNEEDFAAAMSAFRNALCSKKGYFRLEDDYNPDEYRLAIYKSGLEAKPFTLKATEFNLVFECMPQRFLKSGEVKQTLTSGDTLTNPTRFDARPMIEATGYGEIDINGKKITVKDVLIGAVVAAPNGKYYSGETSCSISLDTQYANTGDSIVLNGITLTAGDWTVDSGTIQGESASGAGCDAYYPIARQNYVRPSIITGQIGFLYGTASAFTTSGTFTITTSAYGALTGTLGLSAAYDGADAITITATITPPQHFSAGTPKALVHGETILYSTQRATGNPMYIDLDIGEAYKVEDGRAVSVNNAASLPAELPALVPGANVVTFDNTFSKLEVVPRWWKV